MTLRAVLLGLVLIPLNCYWVIVVEVRWYTLDGSCLPLFVTPVFMLALVTVGNILVGKLAPRRALRQGELLTVYIMLVMSVTMAGHDTLQNMFGHITHYAWYTYQHPDLKWPQTFGALLPRHLQVMDVEALRGFYEGHSTMYRWANLRPWLAPLAWWSAFVLVMVMMMLCLSVLFRRAWTEHEKLSFPIIQLPLALTERGAATSFFRSRLMWMGFALAAAIGILNGLHMFRPTLPFLNVRYDETRIEFRTWPWNAGGNLPMSFYPFAVGLAYFLPLDLSFSCWFFYLFRKLQHVGGAMVGFDRLREFPYIPAQSSGAWLGLAAGLLWVARGWLWQVLTTALGRGPLDDSKEPLRYRSALLGLAAGSAFLMAFWRYAGMSAYVIALFFGLYFLLALAITRVRAELGAPHEIYHVHPAQILVTAIGTRGLGPRNLTGMEQTYWLNRCYRNHPMPTQMEAFKMAETAAIDGRRLLWVMLGATFVAMLATYWAHLHESYQSGAMAKDLGFKWWAGSSAFGTLQNWLEFGEPAQAGNRMAMAAGFLLVTGLRVLRSRYLWWPFHPAGYALGVSFAMDYFWFAFFISWVAKLLLVRYGGMRTHRAAIPFFLGLILGDYTIGSIWAIIGPVADVETYQIFIR
ncbi:MAG: hypothetical protein JSV65_05945 [Armatimonadota bacterium]|nr:MAG: hypothetical protein JSV65_05945 [Armatimonadota bacterium]